MRAERAFSNGALSASAIVRHLVAISRVRANRRRITIGGRGCAATVDFPFSRIARIRLHAHEQRSWHFGARREPKDLRSVSPAADAHGHWALVRRWKVKPHGACAICPLIRGTIVIRVDRHTGVHDWRPGGVVVDAGLLARQGCECQGYDAEGPHRTSLGWRAQPAVSAAVTRSAARVTCGP